ncbi:hypothetical protein [Rhizobium sp. SG741]|uniref:hypothetical protein n=1 Tax=Rhizobium sp. SG741 TaxID=2587114 RepID=UPI001445D9EC|nr:hypothetical protein [Rhizobium sp. SG741]NKJ03110.1 hypothetical protein [Rhizobium sp. SG741]
MALYDFDHMQLRVDHARRALEDISFLEKAFIWSRTPQGGAYWEIQAHDGLTDEARSTIAYMVAQSIEIEIFGGMRRAA